MYKEYTVEHYGIQITLYQDPRILYLMMYRFHLLKEEFIKSAISLPHAFDDFESIYGALNYCKGEISYNDTQSLLTCFASLPGEVFMSKDSGKWVMDEHCIPYILVNNSEKPLLYFPDRVVAVLLHDDPGSRMDIIQEGTDNIRLIRRRLCQDNLPFLDDLMAIDINDEKPFIDFTADYMKN